MDLQEAITEAADKQRYFENKASACQELNQSLRRAERYIGERQTKFDEDILHLDVNGTAAPNVEAALSVEEDAQMVSLTLRALTKVGFHIWDLDKRNGIDCIKLAYYPEENNE